MAKEAVITLEFCEKVYNLFSESQEKEYVKTNRHKKVNTSFDPMVPNCMDMTAKTAKRPFFTKNDVRRMPYDAEIQNMVPNCMDMTAKTVKRPLFTKNDVRRMPYDAEIQNRPYLELEKTNNQLGLYNWTDKKFVFDVSNGSERKDTNSKPTIYDMSDEQFELEILGGSFEPYTSYSSIQNSKFEEPQNCSSKLGLKDGNGRKLKQNEKLLKLFIQMIKIPVGLMDLKHLGFKKNQQQAPVQKYEQLVYYGEYYNTGNLLEERTIWTTSYIIDPKKAKSLQLAKKLDPNYSIYIKLLHLKANLKKIARSLKSVNESSENKTFRRSSDNGLFINDLELGTVSIDTVSNFLTHQQNNNPTDSLKKENYRISETKSTRKRTRGKYSEYLNNSFETNFLTLKTTETPIKNTEFKSTRLSRKYKNAKISNLTTINENESQDLELKPIKTIWILSKVELLENGETSSQLLEAYTRKPYFLENNKTLK